MSINDEIVSSITPSHHNSITSDFNPQGNLKEADQNSINNFNNEAKDTNIMTKEQQQIMLKIVELIQKLIEALDPEAKQNTPTSTASNTGNKGAGGSPSPVGSSQLVQPTDISPTESANDSKIPKATENIQNFTLGNKNISVGSDGSASAAEVEDTAQSIKHAYNSSPTFRNMIDNSSDPAFEVTVGKRADNTSWGNTEGRVFMNLNNIQADNSDRFQALLAHEFAHASIDLPHGAEIERVERAVAQET